MATTIADVVRGLAVVTVVVFLGILVWYLPSPGYTHVRLAFFVVLGGLAVAGLVGSVRQSGWLVAVGVAGLSLLGFWQAVLWVYIFPVVGVLVLTMLVGDSVEEDDDAGSPDDADDSPVA